MLILVLGKKSFLAKNFIDNYKSDYDFIYYNKFLNNKLIFAKDIKRIVKNKKISHILNFIADNNNSYKNLNSEKLIKTNFLLPACLIKISKDTRVGLTLFSSNEIKKLSSDNTNFYSFSKFILLDYIKKIKMTSNISLINLDTVFGPNDLNFNRLIPSMMKKIIHSNFKIKINLKQKKKLIFINSVLPYIRKTLKLKKKTYFINTSPKIYDIGFVYKHLKKYEKNKSYNFPKKLLPFIKTLNWYINYYGK